MNVSNESLRRPTSGRIMLVLTVNVDINDAPFVLDFTFKIFPLNIKIFFFY